MKAITARQTSTVRDLRSRVFSAVLARVSWYCASTWLACSEVIGVPLSFTPPGPKSKTGSWTSWKACRTKKYISISSTTPAIRNMPPYSRVSRIRMVGRNGIQASRPSPGV